MASKTPNPPDSDWTAAAAERIESTVATVRAKTTVPATLAARGIVYGIVAGSLGAALLFLLVIGAVRLLDVYLPYHPLARRVWSVDVAAAAIFLAGGAFTWRRRRPSS